jgi:predicted DNA repair protein MutK
MAGSSFLTLLDDITTVLDDVAAMSKIAAKKTAGVLGDDLALNANQVNGVNPDRELPIVWAVAKGSLVNKIILIPLALILSIFLPIIITPLLMLGGAYLCFEGAEKIIESKQKIIDFFKKLVGKKVATSEHIDSHQIEHKQHIATLTDEDLLLAEKDKIKGAVKTDFILSAEIIVISLGAASGGTFITQALTLTAIGLVMTVGVYGLVAGIVKLDDLGFYLKNKDSNIQISIGDWLLKLTPKLMKVLSVVGTLAMFTVGGNIIVHGLHVNIPGGMLTEAIFGFLVGLILAKTHHIALKLIKK